MKSFVSLLLLSFALLPISGLMHAEGGCPSGMIPYSGADMSSCGPLPANYYGNQKQDSVQPPEWASQWGAIATYEPNGSFGISNNQQSQLQAEQVALENCRSKHGSPCKVNLSYSNQCAAMIVSDKGYNAGSAATVNQAIRTGMKICTSSGDSDCHVYYSACSLPIRIR